MLKSTNFRQHVLMFGGSMGGGKGTCLRAIKIGSKVHSVKVQVGEEDC